MKLKNKKTGEILEVESCNSTGTIGLFFAEGRECDRAYNSLAELNEEWEDYDDPKEYFMINAFGDVETVSRIYTDDMIDELREIGNKFETEEEAKKAVEKLKAWKRLKDKGLKFKGIIGYDETHFWFPNPNNIEFMFENRETRKDLNLLLFGGEE